MNEKKVSGHGHTQTSSHSTCAGARTSINPEGAVQGLHRLWCCGCTWVYLLIDMLFACWKQSDLTTNT